MTRAFAGTTTLYTETGAAETEHMPVLRAGEETQTGRLGIVPRPPFQPVRPMQPIKVTTVTQTSAGVLGPNPVLTVMRPTGPGWPFRLPMPRSRYALPSLISPVASPSSQTLFEEPQDGTRKHYLQQYAIATQGTAAQPLDWVSLAPTAQGYTLTVHVAAVPLQGMPAGSTLISPTTVSYLLSATLLGRVVTWDFTVSNASASMLTLAVTVTGTAARDTLYHAMTDPAAGAQLIVRSAFAIASLAQPATPMQQPLYRLGPPSIDLAIPFTFDPVLNANIFAQITNVGAAGPSTWSHHDMVWNQRSYSYYYDPADMSHAYYLPDAFKINRQAAAPHAPSLQITAAGTDPSAQSFLLSFQATPVTSLARLEDAVAQLTTQSGFPAGVQLAPFEASKTSLALTLPAADETSPPGLQPVAGATIDIAAGVSAAVALSPLQLQQVYTALFDDVSVLLSGVVTVTVNPNDAFSPTVPLSARAADFAGDIFTITTTSSLFTGQLDVVLVNAIESPIHITGSPVVLQKNGVTAAATVQNMTPAPPVDLAVGGSAPAPSASGDGSGAGGLGAGLGGELGGVLGGVLGGSGGSSTTSQLGGLLGGLLGSLTGGGDQGGMTAPPVTPTPTAAPDPTTTASSNPAGAGPASSGSPVAQSFSVVLGLPHGSTSSDPWTVLPDYTAAQVVPDASAIWDAIMSNQVLSPFKRTVNVLALPSLFQQPMAAGGTPATIVAAQVVFSTGETADFNAATQASGGVMTQTVTLSVPLKEYVLQTGDTATYKYRVDLIMTTGTITGQWVSSNQDSFFVQANG